MSNSQPDPFILFQLPYSFDIDLQDLDQRYRALLQVCHPDRAKSVADKAVYQKKAINIAYAYACLKSSLKRAQFLLQLQNIDAMEGQPDAAFLMDMMTLQEDIQDGTCTNDDLETKCKETLRAISHAFQIKNYNDAKRYVQHYHFLTKLGTSTHAVATS